MLVPVWTTRVGFEDFLEVPNAEPIRDGSRALDDDYFEGFDRPEADGRWIVEARASLKFRFNEASGGVIELTFIPYLGPTRESIRLGVRTGDMAQVFVLEEGVNLVRVRLTDAEEHRIVFTCLDALNSPEEEGFGSDKRPLCAKLVGIDLST